MKRITTLLRESEAMAVRKAVCVAGAACVVITPIPQHQFSSDPWQWRGNRSAARRDVHVRLEVTADDDCYGGVVSAIKKISHSGRIILVFRHDKRPVNSVLSQ